jgi:GT2 family glycosyltransferase
MRVSLVIATKSRPEPLRAAIDSAIADLPAAGEIIVVDGDPDRSAEAVVAATEHARAREAIHYLASSPGLPAQRNRGIDLARGEVVVFLDDDCVVLPGMFERLLAAYTDPAVVGATGRILNPAEHRIGSPTGSRLRWLVLGGGKQGTMTSFGFRRPLLDTEHPRAMQYMPGSLMSARRASASTVRFDENLGGYALGEDDDFSYRLSRTGRIMYVPDAVVRHDSLGTRAVDRRSLDRVVILNRVYLYRKNFAGTLRARVGFTALVAMFFMHRIINREWDGVMGLLDGLREVRRSPVLERSIRAGVVDVHDHG